MANDLIIENKINIVAFGNVSNIALRLGWEIFNNYTKPWPVIGDLRLPKTKCYWDDTSKEVKAKTKEMLDADLAIEIQKEIDTKILGELGKLFLNAKDKSLTFAQFLDTIQAIIT